MLSLRGFALAYAMNSGTVSVGTDGIHDQRIRKAHDARNGRNVADEIEIEFFKERGIDCVIHAAHEKRVAVRRRFYDRLRRDIATSSRPVLDNEGLAEPLGQPLPDQSRGNIGSAASSKADDDARRPQRVALGPSVARDGRQREDTGDETQEGAAGKRHDAIPEDLAAID